MRRRCESRGPITPGVNCWRITYPHRLVDRPRRMSLCFRRDDELKERDVSSLPRGDARSEDRFEVLGTVAIGVSKIFIRDAAQLSTQFAGHADGVELGSLAHDRLNGVDMRRDPIGRRLFKF